MNKKAQITAGMVIIILFILALYILNNENINKVVIPFNANGFNTQTLTIAKGSILTFENQDTVGHTLIVGTIVSSEIPAGQSISYKADNNGIITITIQGLNQFPNKINSLQITIN